MSNEGIRVHVYTKILALKIYKHITSFIVITVLDLSKLKKLQQPNHNRIEPF